MKPPVAAAADDQEEPILAVINGLIARLEEATGKPEADLTLSQLIHVIGDRSYVVILLAYALLNLLPGPPGYSVVLGFLIAALSLAMIRRKKIAVWSVLGDRRVPIRLLMSLVGMLRWIAGGIAKVSDPRLSHLTDRNAVPIIGAAILAMGTISMLCPIPFTNTLPSCAVVAFCVGVLNRDGLAVIVGAVLAVLGVIGVVLAVWLVVVLATMVVEVLD